MNEDVSDGLLIDVREVDMIALSTEASGSSLARALERLLASNIDGDCNGFQSSI
jgi:FXSXX-COOH protein